MKAKQWGSAEEATAILSANAGRQIDESYVRSLFRSGHVHARPLDGRTNEYNLDDCRAYTVRQQEGKPPMLTKENASERLAGARSAPQYFAISYEEERTVEMDGGSWQKILPDWFILAGPCRTRKLAENAGREEIERRYPVNPINPQFERATCYKNLRVIAKSQRKAFHVELDDTQMYDEGE